MKRILPIICIGAAFLAVSLWVWLSNGKNAKTVKTKFRLGGVLLTLISSMSISGCGGCRAASEQLYGTFDRVDPVLEVLNILEKCNSMLSRKLEAAEKGVKIITL